MTEEEARKGKKAEELYYCQWCQRHLPLDDGLYIHDDVYHPENFVYREGHRVH